MKERYIEAGQIVNTHGVRGEVAIMPWTDSAEFLRRFKTLYLDGAPLEIESSRVHKNMLLAKLRGVDDVNAAMRLKGKTLYLDREDAHLPAGTYFLQDLLGAAVVTEDGSTVGTLADIMDTPAGSVYVVRGDTEHLIPEHPFVLRKDADAGLVTVRLIEGL